MSVRLVGDELSGMKEPSSSFVFSCCARFAGLRTGTVHSPCCQARHQNRQAACSSFREGRRLLEEFHGAFECRDWCKAGSNGSAPQGNKAPIASKRGRTERQRTLEFAFSRFSGGVNYERLYMCATCQSEARRWRCVLAWIVRVPNLEQDHDNHHK